MRLILGVIVGYAVWSVVWLGTNRVVFAEAGEVMAAGEAVTETGTLLGVLALSIVCSILGGVVAAKIGRNRASAAVIGNGVLLLLTGIFVQMSIWALMPTWYHLSFLALLIPATIVGGKLGGTPRPATA